MFSLIITIISIALVAALAVATIYYGGDAFNQGTTKAKASTIVNQAQQIAGANTLYKSNTGGFAADVAALVTNSYLASAPVSPDLGTTYSVDASNKVSATLNGTADAICKQINVIAGVADGTTAAGKQFQCDTTTKVVTFQG